MKTSWNIIKDTTGSSHPYNPVTKINTETGSTTILDEIAKAFNDFFVHVVGNSDSKYVDINKSINILTKINNAEYTEMKVIPITENEVINTVLTLKTKKSSGYYGISNMILKYCAKVISKPFSHICNFSATNGIFMDRCKYALVLPVYKKGDRTYRYNYQPISVLLTLCKVLEIIMNNRLNQHLNSNRIIVSEQYGFRRGNSIENAIFSLTNTILSSLNKKQVVVGLFCDLSKAFDSVNHSFLLQKLLYYGVRETCHNWFKSYLINRQQKVIITANGGNHFSNWGAPGLSTGTVAVYNLHK